MEIIPTIHLSCHVVLFNAKKSSYLVFKKYDKPPEISPSLLTLLNMDIFPNTVNCFSPNILQIV